MLPLLIATLVFTATFSHQVSAAAAEIWDVEHLLRDNRDRIALRNRRGSMLKWINRNDLVVIDRVWSDIESASELDATLHLIAGDQPNAHAGIVNGRQTVMINLAMFDMVGRDRDQWAALFGHELAHLKLNHIGQASKRKLPLTLIDMAVKLATPDPVARGASDLVTSAIDSKYSRDHERESDYLGAIWAVEQGYDPAGAVRLHSELKRRSVSFGIPFLDSHPSSDERIAKLTELAERLGNPGNRPAVQRLSEINPFEKIDLVRVGMRHEAVEYLIGHPMLTDSIDGLVEWHYCETGTQSDEFIAVAFEGQTVVFVQRYSVTMADGGQPGHCSSNIKLGGYIPP